MALYNEDNTERIELYRLFSSVFIKEPDDEVLVPIINQLGIRGSDSVIEIRMDFVQLFSNAAGQFPPYESLYNYHVWETPRVWGRVTEEVQKFYLSAGLLIDEEIDLVPDHLSAELLFMSYLIEHEQTELQNRFLEEHLCIWVPDFCDEVIENAQTAFYQQVVLLLKEFILDECEAFDIKKNE